MGSRKPTPTKLSAPIRPSRRLDPWLLSFWSLIVVGRILVQFWYYQANLGFTFTFGDDVMRALTAKFWSETPASLPHNIILPLPFWVLGLFMKIAQNVILVSVFLQGAISLAACVVLWRICREIFPDDKGPAVLAVAAAASHPAGVLFSMGTIQMPWLDLAVLSGALFCVKFEKQPKIAWLSAASVCFTLAAMTHYDGWLFVPLFNLFVLRTMIRRKFPHPGWRPSFVFFALPWIWVLIWVCIQASWHGTPFYVYREMSLRSYLQMGDRILAPLGEFLMRFPFVAFLALASIVSGFRKKIHFPRSYLIFPAEIFLTVPLYMIGAMVPYCHFSHLWTSHLLLLPLAARGFLGPFRPRPRYLIPAAALGVIMFNIVRFMPVAAGMNNFSKGIVEIRSLIGNVRREGVLGRDKRVLAETFASEKDGLIWETQALFLAEVVRTNPYGRSWNPPKPSDTILLDREYRYQGSQGDQQIDPVGNPSIFELPTTELKEWLMANNVDLVIAQKNTTVEKIRGFMSDAGRLGSYHLFTPKDNAPLRDSIRRFSAVRADESMPWRKPTTVRPTELSEPMK